MEKIADLGLNIIQVTALSAVCLHVAHTQRTVFFMIMLFPCCECGFGLTNN